MQTFAEQHAEAWSSLDPARIAAHFAENGSLVINNGGTPSVGRAAVTEAARSFMTGYPDMVVTLDRLERVGDKYRFHWNFVGTKHRPGRHRPRGADRRLRGVDAANGHHPVARALRRGATTGTARQSRRGETVALVQALIFDLDGTLVDTVYAHVFAWQRALRNQGSPSKDGGSIGASA